MRRTLLVSVTDGRDENTDCERLMMKRQDSTFCPNDEGGMLARTLHETGAACAFEYLFEGISR